MGSSTGDEVGHLHSSRAQMETLESWISLCTERSQSMAISETCFAKQCIVDPSKRLGCALRNAKPNKWLGSGFAQITPQSLMWGANKCNILVDWFCFYRHWGVGQVLLASLSPVAKEDSVVVRCCNHLSLRRDGAKLLQQHRQQADTEVCDSAPMIHK